MDLLSWIIIAISIIIGVLIIRGQITRMMMKKSSTDGPR